MRLYASIFFMPPTAIFKTAASLCLLIAMETKTEFRCFAVHCFVYNVILQLSRPPLTRH